MHDRHGRSPFWDQSTGPAGNTNKLSVGMTVQARLVTPDLPGLTDSRSSAGHRVTPTTSS